MKGEIKKKYQEYINHIDFPALLYVYETNKIIAMNNYAINIIGKLCEDIRDVYQGKKHKFSKDLLEGESKLIENIMIKIADGQQISIDMDVNIILVDGVRFVFVLFEESKKNKFKINKKIQVPRVSWKYENYSNIYMNSVLKEDIKELGEENGMNNYILDKDIATKFLKIKENIIETGESCFNSIQMITKGKENSRFIKISIMPIIDSKGKNIGVISIHNKILKKTEQQNLVDLVSSNEGGSYNIYEYILDNIKYEILVCLENHIIGYINKSISNSYDKTIMGMGIHEFFTKYKFQNMGEDSIKYTNLDEAINEGFAKEKISDINIYDGFNKRNLSVRIQKIKWIDNKNALLLTFNEICGKNK